MKIINATPHPVTLILGENSHITFQRTVNLARVSFKEEMSSVDYEPVPGISMSLPLKKTTHEDITGLPEPEEGIYYIVSSMVARAATHRSDLISPVTDDTCERDERGYVTAIRSFQSFYQPNESFMMQTSIAEQIREKINA